MLVRRDLLALGLGLLPRPPPGDDGAWFLAPAPDDHVVATERSGPTRLLLPGRRARILATFRLAGLDCAALRLAGRTRGDEDIDLLAVIGGRRVLALEPWAGQATDGGHLATRLDWLPGERGLILRRDAAVPDAARTLWTRQSWTDVLAAAPRTPGPGAEALVDAPFRPPLPGTWQALLSRRRGLVLAGLARPRPSIDPALAALASVWPWQPEA